MIVNAVKRITVGAEKLDPLPGIYKGIIYSALSNAGIIYIGDATDQDFPLEVGNALDLSGQAIAEIYVRGTAADQLVILGIG